MLAVTLKERNANIKQASQSIVADLVLSHHTMTIINK